MMNNIFKYLDEIVPNVYCELEYTKDYELLIAAVLSAQCTDARVNKVTKVLFSKYDLKTLAAASIPDICQIITSVGSQNRKSEYIHKIANSLLNNHNGIVPNDRAYLESLPGVGRKVANVVLKNLFAVPCIPVDTHAERVSKRLGLAAFSDSPLIVESKLMEIIPKEKWNRVSEQLLLFGRYHCRAKNPDCSNCKLKTTCKKDSL